MAEQRVTITPGSQTEGTERGQAEKGQEKGQAERGQGDRSQGDRSRSDASRESESPVAGATIAGGQGRADMQVRREGRDQQSETEGRSRQAIRETTDRIADAGRSWAETGVNAAVQGERTGRSVMNSAAEATSRLMRAASSEMGYLADIGSPETRESVERTAHAMKIVARCGTVVAERSQPIISEMATYTQQALQAQLGAMGRLQRARTVVDLAAAQSDFLRRSLELWVRSGRRIGEMMLQLGEEVEGLIDEEERRARSEAHDRTEERHRQQDQQGREADQGRMRTREGMEQPSRAAAAE